MNLLGLPTQYDPNDGTSAGPALVPTDIDPNNQTRSDARRTYYDPYVSRTNFHIITGQHVTRLLIDGVGSNDAVNAPTSAGNTNGNGPSTGDNDGFGFGPDGSTPPLSGQGYTRFARRQSPITSNLRVSGVEVNIRLSCLQTADLCPVCAQRLRIASNSVRHKRGYHCCRCSAFCSTPSALRNRARFIARRI